MSPGFRSRGLYHPAIALEAAVDEQTQNEQADRRDDREPGPNMEKLRLIRDWRGGTLENRFVPAWGPTPGKSVAASPKLRGK